MSETKQVIVVKQSGCLSILLYSALDLLIFFGLAYLLLSWQTKMDVTSRQELNQELVKDLNSITAMSADLSEIEISGDSPKALFTFYKPNKAIVTVEMEAHPIGGGVFKIYNTPVEKVIGFPPAKWYYRNVIVPQLPEFSFLLVTPYSIEFCTTTGNCKEVKKTADFGNENTKFTYYF